MLLSHIRQIEHCLSMNLDLSLFTFVKFLPPECIYSDQKFKQNKFILEIYNLNFKKYNVNKRSQQLSRLIRYMVYHIIRKIIFSPSHALRFQT